MIPALLSMYAERIVGLPRHTPLRKHELLLPEFRLFSDKAIEMYYSPHNESVNPKAAVLVVGITPGWTQMEAAFRQARDSLAAGETLSEVSVHAKKAARFAGTMRSNLIAMLDELELHQRLGLPSCASLFAERDELLHTMSLTRYPVFVHGANYTGHRPPLMKHEWLKEFSLKAMAAELMPLTNKALIVPLGKAVEDVLRVLAARGEIREELCLFGFPHPSGANGHRFRQLEEGKTVWKERLLNVNFA